MSLAQVRSTLSGVQRFAAAAACQSRTLASAASVDPVPVTVAYGDGIGPEVRPTGKRWSEGEGGGEDGEEDTTMKWGRGNKKGVVLVVVFLGNDNVLAPPPFLQLTLVYT